ncbi:carboxylesterase/lipase family protein [Subtercola boreus]|nr:carboxylesterase family protein [Subtercola boreus]
MSKRPIVDTTAGRVQGVRHGGIDVFKGIPYAASVAANGRFLPAREPAPWAGVRDAAQYGPLAMQVVPNRAPERRSADQALRDPFIGNQDLFRPMSEDCLVLNVWTPSISDHLKRPVMLWVHGGGFVRGVGDADWHDGTRLAREQDVVVVQLNHRLNVFGFLSLVEFGGADYANSGNTGLLDIVTALQWVHRTIEAFGGDRDNVTLFGQSGGGAKISALLAMPAAQGLFHKAVVQSGSIVRAQTQDEASSTTAAVFRALDLAPTDIDGLLRSAPEQVLDAYASAVKAGHNFMPVVDGSTLSNDPFAPDAPSVSASIPLLVGTTKDENRLELATVPPGSREFTETNLQTDLNRFGVSDEALDYVWRSYAARRPGSSPAEIYFDVKTDACFRANAILQAERKAAQNEAAVYMYLFSWEEFSGRLRSPHVVDVPFVFNNVDRAPGLTGPQPDPRCFTLGMTVSSAWAAFARTGSPQTSGLPDWNRYTSERRETMVLGYDSEEVSDPRRDDRLAMQALGSDFPPLGGWVGLAP